jgi:flagellar hook-length control protein FliK
MAALFGGPADVQAQALPATPAPAGGKLVVPEAGEEIDPEAQTEDALSPDAQAALLGMAQPTPPPVSGDLTVSAASASEVQPVGSSPLAAAEAAPQAATNAPTDGAVLDGGPASEDASVQTVAAPAEGAEETADLAAARPAQPAVADAVKADKGPQAMTEAAAPRAPAAPATTAAAPAAPEPVAQPTAAPPPPATAAQASAQPLMTAAAAAGVVTLKASQSEPTSAAAPEVDSAETPDAAPFKAALTDTKTGFAAQPASPFALTTGATTLAAKPEPVITSPVEPALAEAPAAPETSEVGGLDDPDSVGTLSTHSTATPLSEARDAARPAATSATVADLAAQVSRRLEGRSTHFDIQLTPEGLGKVDVRVDIDAQGKLTAAMAFDSPHAANEMRGRSGELLRALEQAGFDLSGGLSFNSPQDQRSGGQFADQAPERDAWQGRAFQSALGMADEADTAAVATRLYQQRQSPTGVDLRI